MKREKQNIVLIGCGQQMNVVNYNIREQGIYNPVCVLDTNKELWGKSKEGVYIEPEYSDFDAEFLKLLSKKYGTKKFFISIGSMKLRHKLFNFFVEQDWEAANIIHPHAVVSKDAKIGKGVLIECGCLVTPQPIIGNNVVVNTGSQVNHDNIIEDHVYIASGVLLSGGVRIGENTLLDDGVIVTLGKSVGCNCIIGAGSVVTKDIPHNSIAYGSPCKVMRENAPFL